MSETTFQFFWRDRSIHPQFRSGVSLHSHTMYSEESLEVIPRYTARVPYLAKQILQESDRYRSHHGQPLDFANAFWTPPLSPRQAFQLEEKQVELQFGLKGLVSLTDHDNIRAGAQLRVLDEFQHAPVSTEWTIPFGPTYFHLGVHNLPAAEASSIMDDLRLFTANPKTGDLQKLLSTLSSYRDVLLVLNHPLWDEKGIGLSEHAQVLGRLLERHGRFFHALELNGLRSWEENQKVMWLGRETGLPVVAGGDRHGTEPNALVNLSYAGSIAEFVHEIRFDRRSHVVFMPQYREPLKLRVLQTMADIVRDYPENLDGRRHWADRVCFRPNAAEAPVALSTIWRNEGPAVVRWFIRAMRWSEWRGVRSALRFAFENRLVWPDQGVAV